jgi:hypothetical protein
MEPATTDNLCRLLTFGFRVLHYTGHGLPSCLAFEDGRGAMHGITAQRLREIFQQREGGAQAVKLVFVSACHCEESGRAFVEAGVPHVIAVRSEAQVADSASQTFMHHFYLALFMGDTVAAAFRRGQLAVRNAPHLRRADEDRKFLLLPDIQGRHEEVIFGAPGEAVPEGEFRDLSEPLPQSNLPVLSDTFVGRNLDMQQIVAGLFQRRVVTVTGEPGMGKSVLANAVGQYIAQRRLLEVQGVYLVPLTQLQPRLDAERRRLAGLRGSVAALCAQIMQLPTPEKLDRSGFAALCKERRLLLILDGADHLLEVPRQAEMCVRSFVSEVLRCCRDVRFLLTCSRALGAIDGEPELVRVVGPLSPKESAQLLYNVAPRELQYSEFHCASPANALQDLAQHAALQLLAGHPRRIFDAAQLLTHERLLDDIVPLVRARLAEEKLEAGPLAHLEPAGASLAPPSPLTSREISSDMLRENRAQAAVLDAALERKMEELRLSEAARRLWRPFNRDEAQWADVRRVLSDDFVNSLMVHGRPLSDADLETMKRRLVPAEKAVVTLASFARWWPFYDGLKHCIARVKEHWLSSDPRIIYGIVQREDAARMLHGYEPGTFLLRFSENNVRNIAVAMVKDNREVAHVLIDLTGERFAIRLGDDTRRELSSLDELVLAYRQLRFFFPHHPKEQVLRPLAAPATLSPRKAAAPQPLPVQPLPQPQPQPQPQLPQPQPPQPPSPALDPDDMPA